MEDFREKRNIFEVVIEKNQKLDFPKIFSNYRPVQLEIGSGRGEFLIEKAEQNPEVNFLALELKEKRIKTILRKLDPAKHKNVKIARIFVDNTITDYILPESFQVIYIIHPDPWPKRKHFKNRLIQKEFVAILWRLLQFDGEIIISTDDQQYAFWIIDIFDQDPDFSNVYEKGFSFVAPKGHIETHFEKKKKNEGFRPYYMKFLKIGN